MKSKVLITGDIHTNEGIFSSICINYLDFLISYIKENFITHLVFDGDIFEKATRIKNEVFIPLFFKLQELRDTGIEIHFILGNHDIYNNQNNSLVETFCVFGKVHSGSDTITIDGVDIDLLSYTKNRDDIPNRSKYLITHLGIAGFMMTSFMEANKETETFSIEDFTSYDKVFSGHFHKYQELQNVIYVGSPYETSFDEEGQKKGFVVFTPSTGDYEFIENDFSPKHTTIDLSTATKEDIQKDFTNKFVGVIIREKVNTFIKLKSFLYDKGAISVVPKFIREDGDDESRTDNEEIINKNLESMLLEFIKSINKDGIKNDKLISILESID